MRGRSGILVAATVYVMVICDLCEADDFSPDQRSGYAGGNHEPMVAPPGSNTVASGYGADAPMVAPPGTNTVAAGYGADAPMVAHPGTNTVAATKPRADRSPVAFEAQSKAASRRTRLKRKQQKRRKLKVRRKINNPSASHGRSHPRSHTKARVEQKEKSANREGWFTNPANEWPADFHKHCSPNKHSLPASSIKSIYPTKPCPGDFVWACTGEACQGLHFDTSEQTKAASPIPASHLCFQQASHVSVRIAGRSGLRLGVQMSQGQGLSDRKRAQIHPRRVQRLAEM